MKKFYLLLIMSFSMVLPFGVNALTLKDGTEVNYKNIHLYVSENDDYGIGMYQFFSFRKDDFIYINRYSSIKSYNDDGFSTNTITRYAFSISDNCFKNTLHNYWVDSNSECIDDSLYKTFPNYYSNGGGESFNWSYFSGNDWHSTQDIYYNEEIKVTSNWNSLSSPKQFTISFTSNIEDYSLIIKDSDGNIISVNEDGTYTLIEDKVYTYYASKYDYKKIQVEFTPTKDETIYLNFEFIIDKTTIIALFNSFIICYLSISKIIFSAPLILFFITFLIIFCIVYIIRDFMR